MSISLHRHNIETNFRGLLNVHTYMAKWISYAVGYVFITSGVMKLLIVDFKISFINLGIPFPSTTLFLVAMIEIICGVLIIAKIYPKYATIPLIVIMIGAIILTKIPILLKQEILSFLFQARLDVVMLILLSLLFRHIKN